MIKYYYKTLYFKEINEFYYAYEGEKIWYRNGLRHRDDGPAGSDYEWFSEGKRHRLNGPAIDYPKTKVWFYKGMKIGDTKKSSLDL